MNFQFYLEKLFASEEFKKFKQESPDCFPISGFFSIDKKSTDNKQHIDFFNPKENKIYSFRLEEMKIHPIEIQENYNPIKINLEKNFNFNEIENLILDKMQEQDINKKIEKLIFSLQQKENELILIGTIFISGLGLIKAVIYPEKNEITEFEKKSFFDMMKIVKR